MRIVRHAMTSPKKRTTDRHAVALRDDDADDEEGNAAPGKEEKAAEDEKMDVDDETKRKPREVQPTGKIVGVIKRNWRA